MLVTDFRYLENKQVIRSLVVFVSSTKHIKPFVLDEVDCVAPVYVSFEFG